MPEKKPTRDAREVVIESLLHYCEELSAQRVVYRKILLDGRMKPQVARDLFDGEIQGIRKKLEPAFHTLWAHLREQDWTELRNTVQRDLDKIEAE